MSYAKRVFGLILPVLALVAVIPAAALADVNFTGDVTPTNVSEWSYMPCLVGHTNTGDVTINGGSYVWGDSFHLGGYSDVSGTGGTGTVTITGLGTMWEGYHLNVGYSSGGRGVLNILDGSYVLNYQQTVIGVNAGSAGTVTVDGSDSTLNAGYDPMMIGSQGQGRLNVQNGGYVNARDITVGSQATGQMNIQSNGVVDAITTTITPSYGTINFGPGGGTLSTKGLCMATGSGLTGTGTIEAKGLVSDMNLTFDSATKTLTYGNVDVNLDLSNTNLNNAGDLGAGFTGSSAFTIQGATINTNNGYLGYASGTSGTATVDGTGSIWRVSSLVMGRGTQGRLLVTNGGTVNSEYAYFGMENDYSGTGGIGTAKVDGSGSTWTNDRDMIVGGHNAAGNLEIVNGGFVHNGAGVLGSGNGNSYIGYTATYTGSVTVDGNDSTFRTDGNLYVGYKSTGYLDISGGGAVTVSGATTAGYDPAVNAYLNFSNGTLTTQMLYGKCLSTDLTGTGTIVTRGLVSDANITFDSSANHTFTIANNVTMNLNMSESENVADLGVGYRRDTGTLTIKNGVTVYSQNGYIGYGEYRDGVATVEGIDSAWISNEDLYVSRQGQGTLNIQNGALVSAADTTYVGSETGNGIVAFSGAGSVLETKNLFILPSRAQFNGAGTINARGVVGNVNLTFDNTDQATTTLGTAVTLNLDMSNSADPGNLGVSYSSTGSLMIQNGAKVYSANGYLAYDDGSSATATVTGSGTVWSLSGDLYVASSDAENLETVGGTGTLNINNDAVVSARRITQKQNPWATNPPSGIVNFDGGTLRARESVDWGFMEALDHVYIKQGGATIDTNGYDVAMTQVLETDGVGAGGLTKIGEGKLTCQNPQVSTGTNTYTGITTVMAGTLELISNADLSLESAWTPVLDDGGADIQNGKLVFSYVDYFWMSNNPASTVETLLGASYTGGTAPWTTGQFRCGTADGSHGLGWIDDDSNWKLTVMYTLYGDSNLDGSVNGTDLNAVLSYYNQSGEKWEHGDFNYDGSVNGTDLNTVLSNYNQSLSSSTTAVPEPSTLLLMVLGLLGLLAWRKRK